MKVENSLFKGKKASEQVWVEKCQLDLKATCEQILVTRSFRLHRN